MYKGGLLKDGRVARMTPKMLDGGIDFVESLTTEQKVKVVNYLGLRVSQEWKDALMKKGMTEKADTDEICMQQLILFDDDPVGYRCRQESILKRKREKAFGTPLKSNDMKVEKKKIA